MCIFPMFGSFRTNKIEMQSFRKFEGIKMLTFFLSVYLFFYQYIFIGLSIIYDFLWLEKVILIYICKEFKNFGRNIISRIIFFGCLKKAILDLYIIKYFNLVGEVWNQAVTIIAWLQSRSNIFYFCRKKTNWITLARCSI